jgi:hypothetical protein
MENYTARLCELFLDRWLAATFFEYCVASVVIVVSGWLVSRLTSR